MPTITGRTKLPGGTVPLTGTWHVRIRSTTGATKDSDGTIRAGEDSVTDIGDGVTMTLPAGAYDFMFRSNLKVGPDHEHVTLGWFPWNLTADVTWGDILGAIVEVPVTPTDVDLANEAADRAEAAAAIAQGSSGGIGGAVDPGDGIGILYTGTADIASALDAATTATGAAATATAAASAAQAVGNSNDTIIAGRINAAGSQTQVAADARYARVGAKKVDVSAKYGGDLVAAIAAEGVAQYILTGSTYFLAGQAVFPQYADLVGIGSGLTSAKSRIVCTTAAAGLTFQADGALSQGFQVDGAGVALNPMLVTGVGAHRLFIDVSVVNAAQDNLIVELCQNHVFQRINLQGAARDNLVLDKGTGGHIFTVESNAAGRYALLVRESTGTGPYAKPQHITFDHSIFERPTSDQPVVAMTSGAITMRRTLVQQGTASAVQPLVSIGNNSQMIFDTGVLTGVSTQAAFQLLAGGTLTLQGQSEYYGLLAAIDNSAPGFLADMGYALLGSGVAWQTAGTGYAGDDSNTQQLRRSRTTWERPAANRTAKDIKVTGDVGVRSREYADGSWAIGPGTGAPGLTSTNGGGIGYRGDGIPIFSGGTEAARLSYLEADQETALLVRVNRAGTKTTSRVSVGAVDSAGTGYRILRVPN